MLEVRSHQPELFRDVPESLDKLRDMFLDGKSSLFDTMRLGSLNISKQHDLNYLGELHVIKAIVDAVSIDEYDDDGDVM